MCERPSEAVLDLQLIEFFNSPALRAQLQQQYPTLGVWIIYSELENIQREIRRSPVPLSLQDYKKRLANCLQPHVTKQEQRLQSLGTIEGIPDPALERNQPDIIFFLATLSRLLIKNPFVALPLLASFGCQYYWQIVATLNPKHTDTTTFMSWVSVAVFSTLVSQNIWSTLRNTREYHAAKKRRSRR